MSTVKTMMLYLISEKVANECLMCQSFSVFFMQVTMTEVANDSCIIL